MSQGPYTSTSFLPSDYPHNKPQGSPFVGNKEKQEKPEVALWGSKGLSFTPSFYCVALGWPLKLSEALIIIPIKELSLARSEDHMLCPSALVHSIKLGSS